MKKIFSRIFFVFVLCFSHFNFCYSDDIQANTDESGNIVSVTHIYELCKPYRYRFKIKEGHFFVIQEFEQCLHDEDGSVERLKSKTTKSNALPKGCTREMISCEQKGNLLIVTVPVQEEIERRFSLVKKLPEQSAQ